MTADELAPAYRQVGPLLGQVADLLSAVLLPVLRQLPALQQPLLAQTGTWVRILTQLGQQLLTSVGPALTEMGTTFGVLLAAAAPLLAALTELNTGVLSASLPILTRLISLVGQLASIYANVLARYINGIVVPALNIVTNLLRGDFSGAWRSARELVGNVAEFFRDLFLRLGRWAANGVADVVEWLAGLPGRAASAASSLGARLRELAASALDAALAAVREGGGDVVDWLRGLPDRVRDAVGNLGSVLTEAGRELLRGFLDGIREMYGSVRDTLGGLTDLLPEWKGPARHDRRILRPAGRLVMAGFADGINEAVPRVRAELRAETDEVAAYRPSIAGQLDAARQAWGIGEQGGGGAATVSIGTFVATERQTPASIARELAWLAKGRG